MKMETSEEDNNPGTTGYMKRCWNYILHKFLVSSPAAVALGISLGLILKIYVPICKLDQQYINFPGDVLIRMLQVVTIPLIVTSVITGVYHLNVKSSGRIARYVAAYYVSTTALSVTIGLILVLLIKPGIADAEKDETEDEKPFYTVDSLLDLVRNMVPQNLGQAGCHHYKTEWMVFEPEADEHNSSLEMNATEERLVEYYVEGANMLGLIVWSCYGSLILHSTTKSGRKLVQALTIFNKSTKLCVILILSYLPFGILFLITSHIIEVHSWETAFKLGKFMLVVVLGFVIHGMIVLPLIYFLCVRSNPFRFIKGVSSALWTAFLLSSSSATLPLTVRCCEDKLMIDKRITRFMLPIGANINMDGTVFYGVVTAVFLAQLNHIHLDIGQLATLFVTSAVSSIEAAGIPATRPVTTLFVVTATGLSAGETSILVVVEWLLSRCIAFIMVMGDCVGVALIHQLFNKELEEMEERGQEITTSSQDSEDDTL